MNLIVLEGCDGTGTSTNAKKLGEALQREGYKTLVYHHPPHRPGGGDWERSLHYARERAEMATRTADDTVVVADRWVYSTDAIAMTLDGDVRGRLLALTALERMFLSSPILVVLLDASDAVLDERLTARGESLPPHRGELRRVYRESIAMTCDVTVNTAGDSGRVSDRLLSLAKAALED